MQVHSTISADSCSCSVWTLDQSTDAWRSRSSPCSATVGAPVASPPPPKLLLPPKLCSSGINQPKSSLPGSCGSSAGLGGKSNQSRCQKPSPLTWASSPSSEHRRVQAERRAARSSLRRSAALLLLPRSGSAHCNTSHRPSRVITDSAYSCICRNTHNGTFCAKSRIKKTLSKIKTLFLKCWLFKGKKSQFSAPWTATLKMRLLYPPPPPFLNKDNVEENLKTYCYSGKSSLDGRPGIQPSI